MKRVGVREFRDHATQYLAGDEVLAIERNGQPIGLSIPTRTGHPERSRQESFERALERLEQTVERVLAETGLSEEELSCLYNLSQPVPDHPGRRRGEEGAEAHAPGR